MDTSQKVNFEEENSPAVPARTRTGNLLIASLTLYQQAVLALLYYSKKIHSQRNVGCNPVLLLDMLLHVEYASSFSHCTMTNESIGLCDSILVWF